MNTLLRHSVAVAAVVGFVLTISVSGCGKKGSPVRPVGSDFPRQYPNPNPTPSPPPDPQQ